VRIEQVSPPTTYTRPEPAIRRPNRKGQEMHVVAPRPSNPQIPMFINVDSRVEFRGTAKVEDVLLVQFLLRKIGDSVLPMDTDKKEAMRNVDPNGVCDEDTVNGIRAFQRTIEQKLPETIVDGSVSSAHGYSYGRGVYTMVHLQVTIRRLFPKVWPRLQDFKDC